jgi:ATP-dependent protease ClpP protease subunit
MLNISRKRRCHFSDYFLSKRRKIENSPANNEEEDDEGEEEPEKQLLNILKKQIVTYEDNHIYFRCDVNEETADELMRTIKEINNNYELLSFNTKTHTIKPKPIYLHITTHGGDLHMGFLVADYIKNSKIPIHTIVEGRVCSAGTIMSVSGKKRYITEHSFMLIHQARLVSTSGTTTKHEDLKDEYENMELYGTMAKEIYVSNSKGKLKKKQIDKLMTRELFMNSSKCIELGFCDSIWKGEK